MREVFISFCLEFPNIPDDFLRTSEHCRKFQKKFQRPLNDDILVCCGKVKCINFWIQEYSIEFNFCYQSCVKEQFIQICESGMGTCP